MNIVEAIRNACIETYATEGLIPFVLPYALFNGSPVELFAEYRNNHIFISDFGCNFDEFKAHFDEKLVLSKFKKIKENYPSIIFKDNAFEAYVYDDRQLSFYMGEFFGLFGQISNIVEISAKRNIDELVSLIKEYLLLFNKDIKEKPKLKGKSGQMHTFQFSDSDNSFIDVAYPSPSKTGTLLRKYVDTLNSIDGIEFKLFLDDKSPEFDKEAQVLSDFATIHPLSSALAH